MPVLSIFTITSSRGILYEVAVVNDAHLKMKIIDIDNYTTDHLKALYIVSNGQLIFEGNDYNRSLSAPDVTRHYEQMQKNSSTSVQQTNIVKRNFFQNILQYFR